MLKSILIANPSVKTFVVGVFTDAATTTNLDAIAQAGGTTKSITVSSGSYLALELGAVFGRLATLRRIDLDVKVDVPLADDTGRRPGVGAELGEDIGVAVSNQGDVDDAMAATYDEAELEW